MDNPMIKNLQEKISTLRKQNLELEDKILAILSRKNFDFHVSPPDNTEIYELIVNLINSATTEVLIITRGFDVDFTHVIINKWKELNQKLILIALDRHLVFKNENIKGYDFLNSSNTLEVVNNPNIDSTFIILDRSKVLLISTDLNKNLLTKNFVTAAVGQDDGVFRRYFKFFNEHLPSFMRIS